MRYNSVMQTMAPMKRLQRPANPPPFEITERDIDVLAFIARVKFATADQIIRFTGGSEKNVGTRIRLLFWHQFLNRHEHQRALIALFNQTGNTGSIYELGPQGKKLLAQRGIQPLKSRAKSPLVPHTIATTEALLSFALASRRDGAPRLIDHGDLLPAMPEATRSTAHPFRFKLVYREDLKTISLNVDPDRLLALLYPDNHQHNFCLEVDMGTETIATRRNGRIVLAKSTFARKQAGYFFGWSEGRHTSQWGWPGFRVLTIAPSAVRIASMVAAQREISNDRAPSAMFLYTTLQLLAEHARTRGRARERRREGRRSACRDQAGQ